MASGTIKRPHEGEDDSHLSFRFYRTKKNHSVGENTVGTYRALRNMDKAIEPRSVSFQFPGAPSSMGSSPSLSSTSPYHPPPSTTFQFILSCWLARFTTKFPLARRSSLHTLYLSPFAILSLFYSAPSFLVFSRYLILFPNIFIFFLLV